MIDSARPRRKALRKAAVLRGIGALVPRAVARRRRVFEVSAIFARLREWCDMGRGRGGGRYPLRPGESHVFQTFDLGASYDGMIVWEGDTFQIGWRRESEDPELVVTSHWYQRR